jgi:hypothetical protein
MLRKDALVGAIVYYDGKCNQLTYYWQKKARIVVRKPSHQKVKNKKTLTDSSILVAVIANNFINIDYSILF